MDVCRYEGNDIRKQEIYAPAKLIRSKKSTSLLGLVPAMYLIM